MGRVFTVKVTNQELATKIAEAWRKSEYYDGDADMDDAKVPDELIQTNPMEFLKRANFRGLGVVDEDLKKVNFDFENSFWQQEEGESERVGLHSLSNGLAYLGVEAGGDWEQPVFFIIYFDGKRLRGYIPEDGNTWNTATHRAYGNDHEARPDDAKMTADILSRIEFKEKSNLKLKIPNVLRGIEVSKKEDSHKFDHEAHKVRHMELHKMLDELLADFITHTGKPVTNRPIMDLMKWSHEQTQKPTER